MNVTLKLPDALCKAARHRAVDEDKSLSGWVADLVRRELAEEPTDEKPKTLLERLGMDEYQDMDIPLPDRKEGDVRIFEFD